MGKIMELIPGIGQRRAAVLERPTAIPLGHQHPTPVSWAAHPATYAGHRAGIVRRWIPSHDVSVSTPVTRQKDTRAPITSSSRRTDRRVTSGGVMATRNTTQEARDSGIGGWFDGVTYMAGLSGGSWATGTLMANGGRDPLDLIQNVRTQRARYPALPQSVPSFPQMPVLTSGLESRIESDSPRLRQDIVLL